MLILLLFLLFSSVSPGLQQEDEGNTEVVDEMIRLFDEMAAPSDNYQEALDRFVAAVPSFLNLSESFGDLFFFPKTFGNEKIPDEIFLEMMDPPSMKKLYKHFKKYDIDKLTADESDIKRSSYYTKMAGIDKDGKYFSVIKTLTLPANAMFKLGFMGFLNPDSTSEIKAAYMKEYYKVCSGPTTAEEENLREIVRQNKSMMESNEEDNTILLDEMEDFLGEYYRKHQDNNRHLLKFSTEFKSKILSINDIEEARETVKKMKEKLLNHYWENDERLMEIPSYRRLEEKAKIILEEADNVTANKTIRLLDMAHGYDTKEIAALLNDYRFEMTRMLSNLLLCAAPEPKKFSKLLQIIGAASSGQAMSIGKYFHKKLRNANILTEERIAKQILVQNVENRREGWFIEYETSDQRLNEDDALRQLNATLWYLGPKNLRRQYLISNKNIYTWTVYSRNYDDSEIYQNYFTCKKDSCFFVPGIAGTDTLVTRHVEANETEIEEFTRQAKHLHRKILPIISSRSKKWDTVEKIVEEIKSRNISLTDTQIGSVAIIRHKVWRGNNCNFESYVLAENRGEDNLPTMRHYKTRHRTITGFFGFDYYACTEVYFFM